MTHTEALRAETLVLWWLRYYKDHAEQAAHEGWDDEVYARNLIAALRTHELSEHQEAMAKVPGMVTRDLDAIERVHAPTDEEPWPSCRWDEQAWPCDASVLAAELRRCQMDVPTSSARRERQ